MSFSDELYMALDSHITDVHDFQQDLLAIYEAFKAGADFSPDADPDNDGWDQVDLEWIGTSDYSSEIAKRLEQGLLIEDHGRIIDLSDDETLYYLAFQRDNTQHTLDSLSGEFVMRSYTSSLDYVSSHELEAFCNDIADGMAAQIADECHVTLDEALSFIDDEANFDDALIFSEYSQCDELVSLYESTH